MPRIGERYVFCPRFNTYIVKVETIADEGENSILTFRVLELVKEITRYGYKVGSTYSIYTKHFVSKSCPQDVKRREKDMF